MERRAVWFARAAGTVFWLVGLLFVLQSLSIARMGMVELIYILLPMPFYLYAMGATWWSLRLIGKGARLAPSLAKLMRRAGVALFVGGLVEVVAAPWIASLSGAKGEPIDLTAVVIGVIGVGLYGVSALIDEARTARAELDGFI